MDEKLITTEGPENFQASLERFYATGGAEEVKDFKRASELVSSLDEINLMPENPTPRELLLTQSKRI